jgi:hypothetical protein
MAADESFAAHPADLPLSVRVPPPLPSPAQSPPRQGAHVPRDRPPPPLPPVAQSARVRVPRAALRGEFQVAGSAEAPVTVPVVLPPKTGTPAQSPAVRSRR